MVKRYSVYLPHYETGEIEEMPDREYVQYTDYAALAKRCERLEAEVIELSWCLWSFMDGTQDHEIQAETGYPDEDCDRIAAARTRARELSLSLLSGSSGGKDG